MTTSEQAGERLREIAERAENAVPGPWQDAVWMQIARKDIPYLLARLATAEQAAVARERAECAKVARDFAARRNFGQTTAERIAAAIEARGQKE